MNDTISADAVFDALRAVCDLMEFYTWFPTFDTARGIHDQHLTTDKITGAIPKRYLTEEVRSAIKTQLDYWQDRGISEPYEFTDDWIRWTYKGVPIEIKILKIRYNFFEYFDSTTYNYDDFKLANPFEKYWRARFLVK